jgi:N-acetylglucosamine repressor
MQTEQKTHPLFLDNQRLASLNNVERKKHFLKIKLIKHFYVQGADSNAEICSRFGLSSPTSMALINELIADGMVRKQGRGKSIGGRKPDLYGLLDGCFYVLSIHVERFKTNLALFDNNNRFLTRIETLPLTLTKDLSAVDQLYAHAQSLLLTSGLDPEKFMGVGVSMPGLVDSEEGRNYTFWVTEEADSLQQVLERKFNKPVVIQNDVKSACLAEFRFGQAQGLQNVLIVSMDYGIGLGLILDGKMRKGSSGFAGEFGHIPLIENGLLCHCGKRGCLETVASGIAMTRMAKEGIKSGQSSFLNSHSATEMDSLEPKAIMEAANKGDQYAINILSEVGIHLGKGIAILIQLFNPELILLGGEITEAKQFITTPIQQSINTYCMPQLRERTRIALSDLGPNASLLGSVATVTENVLERQMRLGKS